MSATILKINGNQEVDSRQQIILLETDIMIQERIVSFYEEILENAREDLLRRQLELERYKELLLRKNEIILERK